MLQVQAEILVKQGIAVVWAVGQVVDRQNVSCFCPEHGFPARIQVVVVNDQPVDGIQPQAVQNLPGIRLP